jgi:hypothetical protein
VLAEKLKGLFSDRSSSMEDGSSLTIDISTAPKVIKAAAIPKDIMILMNVTVKFMSVAHTI